VRNRDWKLKEKIVTVLERLLDEDARIEQHVFFPVLEDETREPRECDVVIFENDKPTVIFEIQDRGKKPSINEFGGWLVKMEEVGVKHLVCVSGTGFPSSIMKKADKIGPSIRLLTLKELERNMWPIPSTVFKTEMISLEYFKMTHALTDFPHLVRVNPKTVSEIDPLEQVYRFPDGRLLSRRDLVDYVLFSEPKVLEKIPFNQQTSLVAVFDNRNPDGTVGDVQGKDHVGNWFNLREVRLSFGVKKTIRTISWKTLGYQQSGQKNHAWMILGNSTDGEPVDVLAPLKRVAPGRYKMGIPSIIGNLGVFIELDGKGYPTKHYTSKERKNSTISQRDHEQSRIRI